MVSGAGVGGGQGVPGCCGAPGREILRRRTSKLDGWWTHRIPSREADHRVCEAEEAQGQRPRARGSSGIPLGTGHVARRQSAQGGTRGEDAGTEKAF